MWQGDEGKAWFHGSGRASRCRRTKRCKSLKPASQVRSPENLNLPQDDARVEHAFGFDGSLQHVLDEILDNLDPCDADVFVSHEAAVFEFPVGEGLSHADAQLEIAYEAVDQFTEGFVKGIVEPVRMKLGGNRGDVLGELALRFPGMICASHGRPQEAFHSAKVLRPPFSPSQSANSSGVCPSSSAAPMRSASMPASPLPRKRARHRRS